MKYILYDVLTGNYVKSTRSRMSTEFTQDIHDAALFARPENAEKALKKMVDKDGNLVADSWYLDQGFGERPLHFWISEERQEEHARDLDETDFDGMQERAAEVRAEPVATYKLEVRAVKFVLQ